MSRPFTIADILKSPCGHLNQHLAALPKAKVEKADPIGLQAMIAVLERLNIPYKREVRFHEKRKWRFDLAIPFLKLGVEYEGLMSKKSRHTTAKGYTGDAEKYNAAQALGWRVLRYTAINYRDFETDLLNLIKEMK